MSKLTDQSLMPFGKHIGKRMSKVPATYLLWLCDQIIKKAGVNNYEVAVKEYVEENKDVLDKQYFEENT